MKYTHNMRKIATLVLMLGSVALSFPTYVGAVTCTDGTTGCGLTAAYSMSASCNLVGSDVAGGNRILGGQVCAIGGTDVSGYSMTGTDEPKDNTSYFANAGTVAPGWSYNKTPFIRGSIPSTEFQDDPYYNIAYFGGLGTVSLGQPDDDSQLTVGSNTIYYTGCNARVTDVTKSGCPSRTFVGNTSFNINPGDPIVFTVTNRLRPNNGSGTWATGNASITLGQTTQCFTKAHYAATGGRAGGVAAKDYHPVSPGVCAPTTSACVINSFTASAYSGGSATLNWNVSANGNEITLRNENTNTNIATNVSAIASTQVSPTETTTYTLKCGDVTQSGTVTVPLRAAAKVGVSVPTTVTVSRGTDGKLMDSLPVTVYFWNAGGAGSSLQIQNCIPVSNQLTLDSIGCSGTFSK